MSSKTIAPVARVHRNPLFPSNSAHPDGESCNEQAYRNERQNVVDEIGHVGNSSVFTYVYFLFYFCSKVNTRFATAFILGFTNSEYTTAGRNREKRVRVTLPGSLQAEPHLALRDAACGGSSG
nr:hypothetical protein [Brucella intermedia]